MKRALLLACLCASPAAAQVNSYNPYVNLNDRGPVSFRPYVSLDRLNIQHQYRVAPHRYFPTNVSSLSAANSSSRQSGFRYYPNYPSLSFSASGFRGSIDSATTAKNPLPMTAPLPVEYACDPYMDDDGCLSEIAGW
jgi:hypothetical protein